MLLLLSTIGIFVYFSSWAPLGGNAGIIIIISAKHDPAVKTQEKNYAMNYLHLQFTIIHCTFLKKLIYMFSQYVSFFCN